ncbi:putative disease resistance RPP13-like protein 2 [Arachis stenosperma]|uniref:putative disease resistance RPP13-like protein 2 n=1 Tax=Arachis stenosperma TaxID=217475 RepID=UPI0025AD3895|nr:putative disease resistance RPP13-like protein 2 [Arachis stenosperma]
MLNHSKTSDCIQPEEDNTSFYVKWILWLLIFGWFGISLWYDCWLKYYKGKVKWIENKLPFLEALKDDHYQLTEEADNLRSRGREFWGSEDLSEINLWLSKEESLWVNSTETLVSDADACIKNYKKQSQTRIPGCFTAILRLISIRDVFHQIDRVKTSVEGHLENKDKDAKDIYDSMQKSRLRNRSLLDQYAAEESQKTVKTEDDKEDQKQRKPSTSINELMRKSNDLFAGMEKRRSVHLLLPLHAFTNELSQLQLETNTENLWKGQAKMLIAEAEDLITAYSWWVSYFGSIRDATTLLKKYSNGIPIVGTMFKKYFNGIPIKTTQFEEDMERIVDEFHNLLDTKSKWKFDFIDSDAMESELPFQNADDDEITSTVNSIRIKLDQSGSKQEPMNSLYHQLEEMNKELRGRREETAVRKACLEHLKSISQEVDHSVSNFLKEKMNNLELQQILKATDMLQKIVKNCYTKRQNSPSIPATKNVAKELVSKLTTSSGNLLTLSIVGMKGVGKTTLAKEIFYNKDVINYFPVRVWVADGTASKVKVLLMKQDGTIDHQALSITEVRDHLKGKRGLIVLDNISKKDDFDKYKKELISETGMTNGSRILLTTPLNNIASYADTCGGPHQIRLMTKDESWALFQKVTMTVKPKENSQEEKLAKKVVSRCGGLPLLIVSIGFLLSVKGSITEDNLRPLLRQINHGHQNIRWLQAWVNTNQELNETLSDCLYYMTLFPADFEIPVRRLVNLWIAEGLVKQRDDNQETLEATAETYLENLNKCNMIQAVALKSNGKIKTYRLPSMLREIILADKTSHSQYSGTHVERRFAYRFDDRGLDANAANVFSKKKIPLSVFFFDKREGCKPGEHIGRILSTGIANEQFMEISVLDLERVFRPQLPDTLGMLIHLKYLGLRWTYLEEFPTFICKLENLETLDVKHTCIRVFPSFIWKLKKLKNLYLNQDYRSRLEGRPSGNFQHNLYRLWGVFIYGRCPLLFDFQRLKNLGKLKLAFQLKAEEQDTLAKKIVQLNQLESLRLRSVNEMGEPEKLILRDISKLEKLASLQLYGKLENGLRMNHLPQNLINLTLSASKLQDSQDPMQLLQSLEKLESLCFYADSYHGKSMLCNPGSFPKLLVLRFWNLRNLEEWNVKEGAMPSLREFEARSCEKLAVPTGLKYLGNIQLIKLHKMSNTFMREILSSYKKKILSPDVRISPFK